MCVCVSERERKRERERERERENVYIANLKQHVVTATGNLRWRLDMVVYSAHRDHYRVVELLLKRYHNYTGETSLTIHTQCHAKHTTVHTTFCSAGSKNNNYM